MKKKVLILLACFYLLAAGAVIAITLSNVYQLEHERTSLGQEITGTVTPQR